jgi:putative addiction module component (TIGR02574 family)
MNRGFAMPTIAKKIIDEVLLLPTDTRVSLVEQLLTSLNLPTQPEVDRLWAKEAERRITQIQKGKVKLLPGEKVFSDIRKKYQR